MSRIRILDPVLANQIAAGEVVERPANAAKELLENAIDAGATRITCEVADGGVALLRVVDDGSGMGAADAELALQRHATSKITRVHDLHHLETLGFRGEALPSIASVSRFTLRTREAGALGAIQVRVEGGLTVEVGAAAGPVGTEIRVEDLFYNVPARRKFLKKEATEATHVLEIVQQLALCYPGIAFRFIKDGRVGLDLAAHESLRARAAAVFGDRTGASLAEVRGGGGGLRIDGLIAPPAEARSTPRHYHTFINGRAVRDRVVMAAVQSAYGHRLERGRHPFVILRITLPPEAVDVNVHPAKTEVRFVDSSAVHRLVAKALGETLDAEPWRAPAPEAATGRGYVLTGEPAGAPPAGLPDEGAGVEPARGGATGPASGGATGPAGVARAGIDAHRQRIFDVMARLGEQRAGGLGRVVPRSAHTRDAQPTAPPAAIPGTLSLDLEASGAVRPTPPGGEAVGLAVQEVSVHESPAFEALAPGASPPVGGRAYAVRPVPAAPVPSVGGPGDPRAAPADAPPRAAAAPAAGDEAPPASCRLGHARHLADLDLGALQFLGPLGPAWFAARADDGVVLFSVAAVRTRLAYDRLLGGAPGQPLSPPLRLDLPPGARPRLDGLRAHLEALGLEIEHFGAHTERIQRLPAGLPADRAPSLIERLLAAGPERPALALIVAAAVAEAGGPATPTEARGWPAALDAVRHRPPRPLPYATVLTDAELARKLTEGPLGGL